MHPTLPTINPAKCILFFIAFFLIQNLYAQVNPPQTFDNSRCGPGEITLTASGCTGGTLKWYNDALAGNIINTGTTYTLNIGITQNFYVSCTLNGIESTRTKITASVNPPPPGGSGGNIIGCGPTGLFLTATGCSEGTIKWFAPIMQNNTLTKGALLYTGSVYNPQSPEAGNMFLATCTVNGCESTFTIFMASYWSIPPAPTTNNGSRCGPGEVTLQVTNPLNIFGQYNWFTQPSGGLPFAQIHYNYPSPNTLKVNVSSTTSYWVSYKHADGCESPRTEVKAIVNPLPAAPTTTGGSRPNAGTVNLSASGCTGGVFNWYNAPVNGTIVNTGTNYSPFVSSTTSYWVSCTLNGCQGPRSEVTATISPSAGTNTAVTIPFAYALPKGVFPNMVYKGYAPASSITLTAIPSGSNSPYQYLWSNGATTYAITVNPSATQNYTVTITDKNGCTATATTTVHVTDIRCGKGDKVLVCKRPPGNASKSQEICIAPEAVSAHLATGSYLGDCLSPVLTKNNQGIVEESKLNPLSIQPNPSTSSFIISLNNKDRALINVYDISGRLIEKLNFLPGQKLIVGEKYERGVYYLEFIQGNNRKISRVIKL